MSRATTQQSAPRAALVFAQKTVAGSCDQASDGDDPSGPVVLPEPEAGKLFFRDGGPLHFRDICARHHYAERFRGRVHRNERDDSVAAPPAEEGAIPRDRDATGHHVHGSVGDCGVIVRPNIHGLSGIPLTEREEGSSVAAVMREHEELAPSPSGNISSMERMLPLAVAVVTAGG